MQLYERINKIRKLEKLSQVAFSNILGISRGHTSKIENGTATPSDQLIKLICAKFGIGEDWLRTGKGDMKIALSSKEWRQLDEISTELTYEQYRSKIDAFIDSIFLTQDRLNNISNSYENRGFIFDRNHFLCDLLLLEIDQIDFAYKALIKTILKIVNKHEQLIDVKKFPDVSDKDLDNYFDSFYTK